MKPYKNFLVSGCSFTAGVVNPKSVDEWTQQAFVWPHYCLLEMNPSSTNFLNFALPGGGNIAAINNLVYYLELHKEVNSSNTLIGLNFTGLERHDAICHADHVDANNDLAAQHIREQLNIGWIHGYAQREHLQRGITQRTIQSCLSIVQGITYLESKGIDYFFMTMTNSVYSSAPPWFKEFLDARTSSWIKFGNTMGMMEFVKQHQLTESSSNFHPSKQGHRLISQHILAHLREHG